MIEIWKPVTSKGFEDFYEVSDLGRIRRTKPGGRNTYVGKILSGSVNAKGTGKGYRHIKLWNYNCQVKCEKIHRLVAGAFLGLDLEDSTVEVNHEDTNRLNNRLDNLKIVTHKQNMEHAASNNLMSKVYGEQNHASKLTDAQIKDIKLRYGLGISPTEIALKFGITRKSVYNIVTNRTWSYVA